MRLRAMLWPLALCSILWAPGVFAQAQVIGEVFRVRQVVKSPADPEKRYLPVKKGEDTCDKEGFLKPRDKVYEGMKVVTCERAGTAIRIDPPSGRHGLVQLGSNTELKFEKWIVEAGQGGHEMRLYIGRLAAAFWPATSKGEQIVTIQTPTGPVTLHSTAVYLDVAPGSTFIYVREGQATVQSLDEEGNRVGNPVSVPEGWQTHVTLGRPPDVPVPFLLNFPGGSDLGPPFAIIDPLVFDPSDPRLNLPK